MRISGVLVDLMRSVGGFTVDVDWSMGYPEVIEFLGFDHGLAACAAGDIGLPLIGAVSPAEWYAFPPALVPIASDGSGPMYLGLWTYWFSTRPPSFVTMSVEHGRTLSEIARTTDQFFAFVIMKAIVESDGLTSDIGAFAQAVGVSESDLNELNTWSMELGDDQTRFWRLPVFSTQCPLASCLDISQYDGSFPTDPGRVRRSATDFSPFEVDPSMRLAAPDGRSRAREFETSLSSGDVPGAWLALNSPGWVVSDARDALSRLANACELDGLELVRDAWCSLAIGPDLSY